MDSQHLMELAVQLAKRGLDESVEAIADAADGNFHAVIDASAKLAKMRTRPGTTEDIAFTYLSGAFQRLADDGYPNRRKREPSGES
jgi:hypothetical protein